MMTIREKNTGRIVDGVLRDTVGNFIKDCGDHTRWYDAAYYEKVHDETWEDVTGSCKMMNGRLFYFEGVAAYDVIHRPETYRLRKVVLRSDDIGYKQLLVPAFIIEKKA